MTTPPEQRREPNIGQVIIDPSAEAPEPSKNGVGGKAEEAFYNRAKQADELSREALKIGWLGRVWGYSTSAPTNIAGFIAFISVIVWVASAFAPADSKTASELSKNAFTLITSCLAYIFGAAASKKNSE